MTSFWPLVIMTTTRVRSAHNSDYQFTAPFRWNAAVDVVLGRGRAGVPARAQEGIRLHDRLPAPHALLVEDNPGIVAPLHVAQLLAVAGNALVAERQQELADALGDQRMASDRKELRDMKRRYYA